MHESQLQPEEKPHKRDLFCTDEIRYDGENSKTLHVLILDDGVCDGSLRFNQLQKWILLSSSGEDWVLLQRRATQALVFWMNLQVQSIVHCTVVFYMLTCFQKWDYGLWKKLQCHLVHVLRLPILAKTDGYGRLRYSCFAWLILVLVFLSCEQAAARKTIRDNSVPCVFDFLEWIYKKLEPGRLCGKNLLPSL